MPNSQNLGPVKKNKFLIFCATKLKKHWLLYLLFVRLSAIWYSLILTYSGEKLRLIKITEAGSKALTLLGWICTIALFLIILLGEISKGYEENLNEQPFEIGGFAFLNDLRKAVNNISANKKKTLLSKINSIKQEDCTNIPLIVSDPTTQLDIIAKEMTTCLCSLLTDDRRSKWKSEHLYVSIAYQFPKEDSCWHWATEEHGLSFSALLNPPKGSKSTFLEIESAKGRTVFYNSKADAEKARSYIPDDFDERDSEGKLKGSIACYKNSIKKNDVTYIKYILTITTYSRKFVECDSRLEKDEIENVRHNLKEFIVSDFFERIDVELCLLYLEFLHKKASSQNIDKPLPE